MIDYENSLNKEQLSAVTSAEKKIRVIAGAGTGKTRVLTYRVCYLIDHLNYKKNEIVCITFTNKVAKEMNVRLNDLLNLEPNSKDRPYVSTFHSFALRLLRKFVKYSNGYSQNFTVYDDDDQYKAYFKSLEGDEELKKLNKNEIKTFKHCISILKNKGIHWTEFKKGDLAEKTDRTFSYENIYKVYKLYSLFLNKVNAVDFDDILLLANDLVKNNPEVKEYCQKHFKCILIDEFQDTNDLQFEFIQHILSDDTMLMVVGDPDQTIYSWRGADTSIITNRITQVFPDMVTLNLVQNYRCAPDIINHANSLIAFNKMRIKKDLIPFKKDNGLQVRCVYLKDNNNEAIWLADQIYALSKNGTNLSDIAVIYRANYLSREIERRLTEKRIPYNIYGGLKFYERMEIKDCLAYLRFLVNKSDDLSFERVMRSPSRGAGDVVFNKAKIYTDEGEDLYDVFVQSNCDYNASGEDHPKVKLTKVTRAFLDNFVPLYDETTRKLTENPHSKEAVMEAVNTFLEKSGFFEYIESMEEKRSGEHVSSNRMLNIKEFLGSIESYFDNYESVANLPEDENKPTLRGFLQNASLVSSQDEMINSNGYVNLMTAHVAKGLEFKIVFICGLAENIFPSIHNASKEAIEEERRLLFVAMTRAMERLVLMTYGGYSKVNQGLNIESRFLGESNVKVEKVLKEFDHKRTSGDIKNNGKIRTKTDEEWVKNSDTYKNSQKTKSASVSKFSSINKNNSQSSATTFAVGDKVTNETYGDGVVIFIDDKKIKVNFASTVGEKTFILSFAKLKKI